MSKSGKPSPEKGKHVYIADRMKNLGKKLKLKDKTSPISPLKTGIGGGAGGGTSSASSSGMTATSSSSSSSGSFSAKNVSSTAAVKRPDGTHSTGVSGSSESSPTAAASVRSAPGNRNYRPGHVRSSSAGVPSKKSAGSSVRSPSVNILPFGNICPSGKIVTSMSIPRGPVLRYGTANYGYGNVKGKPVVGTTSIGVDSSESAKIRQVLMSSDPEEVKTLGNEQYRIAHYAEALSLYDRAIKLSPKKAEYHSNRAAALTALGRLFEAVSECEEAVKLDPGYVRAHHRLADLHLRLGQVENARKHLCAADQQPDQYELQTLKTVERHIRKCANARKVGDWKRASKQADAAIAAGADSSPPLFACRTEALLKLNQIEAVDASLAAIPKFDLCPNSCAQCRFFGILSESYVLMVTAQVDMAFGRFENAVAAAEKAGKNDPTNVDVTVILSNIKLVAKARTVGNEFFNSGNYVQACSAYGNGLKIDSSNSVLYCNRAVSWSKLREWEKSLEDCNQALKIQPNNNKALLLRAASYSKLERWVESLEDYKVLRKKFPKDNKIGESLFYARVGLKKSRGEDVQNMAFHGEFVIVLHLEQFRAFISSTSVSVVLFKAASDHQCELITPVLVTLRTQYPSMKFLKVDVNDNPEIAKAERVNIIPTVKIYQNGKKLKEIICPSTQVLESTLKQYSSL